MALDPKLRTELSAIDRDHEVLGLRIDEFVVHLTGGTVDLPVVITHLNEIRHLAADHFEREEQIMQRLNYHDGSIHGVSHRYFIRCLVEYVDALSDGTIDFDGEAQTALVAWIRYHLTCRDAEFETWLAGQRHLRPSRQGRRPSRLRLPARVRGGATADAGASA